MYSRDEYNWIRYGGEDGPGAQCDICCHYEDEDAFWEDHEYNEDTDEIECSVGKFCSLIGGHYGKHQ